MRLPIGAFEKVGLGQDDAFGDGRLPDAFWKAIKGGCAINGIDGRHYGIEGVAGTDKWIGQDDLQHRSWVSDSGGFDDDAIKLRYVAGQTHQMKIAEGIDQIAFDRAAQAAIFELHH